MNNELSTKNPVGRPRFAGNARLKRSVMIDDDDLAIIAQLGAGNNSEGVHVLVEFYKAQQIQAKMHDS